MSIKFDALFPAGYEVRVIESAPADALVFERPGSVHSGEVIVEVTTDGGRCWVGAARAGGPSVRGALSGVFSTPAKTGLLLLGRGDAYFVDVEAPERFEAIDSGGPVVAVRPALDEGLMLLASPWTITALGDDGVRWQTGRLAIEGIRMDEVQAGQLAGVADPGDDEPRDFVVDLHTGCHEGGVPFD
ncbi:MAG: hypothetical protein ACRD1K_08995 [Acidimicrobiales bacterium]